MTLDDVLDVLTEIKGCTFATLDCETVPSPGMLKRTTNERVILFTNQRVSGYEQMVRRRLVEAGKDPDSFRLNDLQWGERVPGTPLIKHETVRETTYYLQTIVLKDGEVSAFISGEEILPADLPDIFLREKDRVAAGTGQGLDPERAVLVRTYKLESIKKINVLGESITAEP